DRLKAVESLIPEALRPAIQAGPIEDGTWCLLVNSNAAAAKLRLLLPLIQSRLIDKGWKVTSIRLKILIRRK
ncbi:DciA family protein, partial [Polaromonas sp.]|uniref:DciA family protein n=1 Tax=Polaromonas sp. TaxID=1869339 RepID=UPI002730645F